MASPDELLKQAEAWPTKAADKIESLVEAIRGKTVNPLVKLTRAIVYGILALGILAVVAVLFSIAALRILDDYVFENRVWLSYFVVGGILTLSGLLLWTKRSKRH